MPTPRTLAFVFGIVLIVLGFSMRIAPAVWDGQRWLASDTFTKVGLVLVCMWMAWPGLESMRRMPGGMSLLFACAFVFCLFLYNRRTILITGPFLAVAIAVAYARGWLSKHRT